jgi:hypothetical protein
MTRWPQTASLIGLGMLTAWGCDGDDAERTPGTGGTSGNGSGGVADAAGGATGGAPQTGGASGTVGGSGGDGGAAGITSGSGGTGGGATNVCGTAGEGESITLACPAEQVIDEIVFASYGTASGTCGSFADAACHSASSLAVVEALCLGRNTCTVTASNGTFGDPCNGTAKRLSVEARCGASGPDGGTTTPFKGVANSPCAARTALNVSWYYNWTQNENEPCADGRGGEFVPMIWGHEGNERSSSGISNAVATFVSRGQKYVLGFNEPDNPTQSNIPVTTAITLWPSFDNPAIQVGSPGTAANANPGQAWFTDFMTRLNANSALRADFLAIHWYGWNAGSCDANAAQLENYIRWAEAFAGDRPIWITEWGCLNQSAPDVDTVVRFYNGALAMFARHPRIVRYAWYPWATNCGLNNSDGTLTPLGVAYAAAPAYR